MSYKKKRVSNTSKDNRYFKTTARLTQAKNVSKAFTRAGRIL